MEFKKKIKYKIINKHHSLFIMRVIFPREINPTISIHDPDQHEQYKPIDLRPSALYCRLRQDLIHILLYAVSSIRDLLLDNSARERDTDFAGWINKFSRSLSYTYSELKRRLGANEGRNIQNLLQFLCQVKTHECITVLYGIPLTVSLIFPY